MVKPNNKPSVPRSAKGKKSETESAIAAAEVAPTTQVKKHVGSNKHLTYVSYYATPGATKTGVDDGYQKRVWKLKYGVTPQQKDHLENRFPGLSFIVDGFACHDHPISHISNTISWHNVLELLPSGSLVADICGNPAINKNWMQQRKDYDLCPKIDTFCSVLCAKDALRKVDRWGPKTERDGTVRWEEVTLYDMWRNPEAVDRVSKYNNFLMQHVLYYYTFEEINKLLNMNYGSMLTATIHKLPGQSGTINCGEQEYKKDLLTGKVHMWNTETGEFYEHPDPKIWFEKFSYADRSGGFTWSINKGCDDTYVIKAVACPPKLVPPTNWLAGVQILVNEQGEEATVTCPVSDDPPPYAVEKVVIDASIFVPGSLGRKRSVSITHPGLLNSLEMFMINRPRTARNLVDLTAKAHREAGNSALLGGNGVKLKITPQGLTEHIAVAFTRNAQFEDDLSSNIVPDFAGVLRGQRSTAKRLTKLGLASLSIIRSTDPAHRVLQLIDDLL